MGCEPCKNFKCKYEHMKLIEKVKKLEFEKFECDNCQKCQAIIDYMRAEECVNSGKVAMYKQEITNWQAKYAKLNGDNLRLQIALWCVCGALVGSLIVIAKLLIGG